MTALLLNGIRAVSVRLLVPERGAWSADVDLDPDVGATAPTSGAATLQIGDQSLVCTIDPRWSGRFVSGYRVRVVAGAGGWDKPIAKRDWHNDAGVNSTDVYGVAASQIGEMLYDPSPIKLGVDFVVHAAAASRVFRGRDWFVDLDGFTKVMARPAAPADVTSEILGYDAATQTLDVASDLVIVPGTTFTDARFDGTLVAREVEQTFSTDGGRATIRVATEPRAGLADILRSAVEELGGLALLRVYRYRYVNSTVDRLNLQAVDKGAPDLQPVSVWPGMAGLAAKLTPSQTVLVAFIGGDPSMPIVVGFDGTLPREVSLDATDKVHIAPSGSNPGPVARMGDSVSVFFPPTCPIVGTVGGSPFVGVITIVNPAPGVITSGSGKADCGT